MESLLHFLALHRWIYDFKLTHIFIDDIFSQMPEKWQQIFRGLSEEELTGLPFGKLKESWPESLKDFISSCQKFSISRDQNFNGSHLDRDRVSPLDVKSISESIRRGMSDKKLHEVCHMTALIDHVTRMSDCNVVVDVGSGLGYLGQVLHSNFGHSVLGLEGKHGHTSAADTRTGKHECMHLQNVTCELRKSHESMAEFVRTFEKWYTSLPAGGSTCAYAAKLSNEAVDEAGNECLKYVECLSKEGCLIPDNSVNDVRSSSVIRSVGGAEGGSGSVGRCHRDVSMPAGDLDVSGSCVSLVSRKQTDISDHKALGEDRFVDETSPCCLGCHSSREEPDSRHDTGTSHLNTQPATLTRQEPARVCMVGLHCCGDLTPTMLHFFSNLDIVTSLCCVSCCYHRMKWSENQGCHDNFPLSKCVKRAMLGARQSFPGWSLSQYSMRLAAQETRARWRQQTQEEHSYHSNNVTFRGILEQCLVQGGFQLKKTSRKLAHRKDFSSFQMYTSAVMQHIVTPGNPDEAACHRKQFQQEMSRLYAEIQHLVPLIEPLTALQVLLQPVLESLVYLDRQSWLEEEGYPSNIAPVFDEYISPRNLALVAIKKKNA